MSGLSDAMTQLLVGVVMVAWVVVPIAATAYVIRGTWRKLDRIADAIRESKNKPT